MMKKKPKITAKKETAMNGYLVVLRHTMDDLPIKLCATYEEALAFAKKTKGMPTRRIRDVIGTDCSTPHSVSVYVFEKGELIEAYCVKEFAE